MRERLVLGAFVIVVLFGGANFVAGKITIRELSPFWAATLCLAAAAILLFHTSTWTALVYPIFLGSTTTFVLFLFVLKSWPARR